MTQYVFDSRQALRYRFPTHTNDLIMDRRDAAASEAFFVILEPGEAPPLHVHDGRRAGLLRPRGRGPADRSAGTTPETFPCGSATSSGRRPGPPRRSAAPEPSGSCTSASTASPPGRRPPSRPGTAMSGRCAQLNGWDFDAVRLGPVADLDGRRCASGSPRPQRPVHRQLRHQPRGPARDRPIRRPGGPAPSRTPTTGPIFETNRLNVTHVRIQPGETVPAHTHDDEDQVYYVATGEGFVELDRRPDRRRGGKQRPHPAGHRAPDHQHRHASRSTTSSSSCSSRSTRERARRDRLRVVGPARPRGDRRRPPPTHVAERLRGRCSRRRPGSGRSSPPRRPRPSSSTALARAEGIDWCRVEAFHLDEYVGLPLGDPRSFGTWLDRHIFALVRPGRVELIDGGAPDPTAEAERATARSSPTADSTSRCIGIGENGHLAFNDPHVADFDDPLVVKPVEIDDTSRRQQVRDGAFAAFDAVPRLAMTVTMSTILASRAISVVVPGAQKAAAVARTLDGPIETACPGLGPAPPSRCGAVRRRSGAVPARPLTATRSRRGLDRKEDRSWRRSRSTAGRRSGPGRSAAGRSSARKRRSCSSRHSGPATGARSTARS